MLKKLDRFSPNGEALLGAVQPTLQATRYARSRPEGRPLQGRGGHPPERLQTSGLRARPLLLLGSLYRVPGRVPVGIYLIMVRDFSEEL